MSTAAAVDDRLGVDFWFDPSCPFTWTTSRWLRAIDPQVVRIRWRLMSLPILNANADISEEYQAVMARAVPPLRVLAAAEARQPAALGALYESMGRRRHEEGRPYDRAVFEEALEEAGLDPSLADEAEQSQWDDVVAASHRAAQASVGEATGSPIIAFGGRPGFFGPVLSAAPSGEDGERLLNACRALAAIEPFAELKRSRRGR